MHYPAAVESIPKKRKPVPVPTRQQATLYRVFWRWHFYTGMLIAPILLVIAVTGALYVFKDELERVMYPDVLLITPQSGSVPYEQQIAAAVDAYPGSRASELEVHHDPTRATAVAIRSENRSGRRVYVNPHTGAVQGAIGDGSFFRVVLSLHRTLLVGTIGRIITELATCWTIVTLGMGLYLWWPRRRQTVGGVWLPRLRAKRYTVLRDLHVLAGVYVLPIALTIACTGLVYTFVWGGGYYYARKAETPAGFPNLAKSAFAPPSSPLSLGEVLAIARQHCRGGTFLCLRYLDKPGEALSVLARGGSGPTTHSFVVIDRSTGSVMSQGTHGQFPGLYWWSNWNYSLHVGSVLGLPTKVIWLIACLVLAALPMTGAWMWWTRRPEGQIGLPRRPDVLVPWWVVGCILLFAALLPSVGASILLIFAGEWLVHARPVLAHPAAAGTNQGTEADVDDHGSI